MTFQHPTFLENIGVDLLLTDPFLGKFFAQINKVVRPSIDHSSWGIDESLNFCLFYHPDLERIIEESNLGVIKHQILHLLLEHPLKMAKFADPALFQLAADLELQQYLLPEEQLKELHELRQALQLNSASQQNLYSLYQSLFHYTSLQTLPPFSSNYHSHLKQHCLWPQFQKHPPREQVVIRSKLHRLLRKHLQHYISDNTLPGRPQLIEQIKKQAMPSEKPVNWQQKIRQFAISSRGSRLQTSLRRPSRRYGTWPGSSRKRQQHLIVVIDTSASLKEADIHRFFQQIHLLWKAGTLLTIIESDDQVRRHYEYRGQLPEQIRGRGQTLFSPALQYASEHFSFDGLLYFTDGYGPAFNLSFAGPLLWIISPDGIKRSHQNWNKLPGGLVKINKSGAKSSDY